jgi:hypothetical protein
LTPEYLMARYHMGVIRERMQKFEDAEREFRSSVEDGVGEASSLFHLAGIARSRGNDEEADELLRRARQFGRTEA